MVGSQEPIIWHEAAYNKRDHLQPVTDQCSAFYDYIRIINSSDIETYVLLLLGKANIKNLSL